MFYVMNKLRPSEYLCTPSGADSKAYCFAVAQFVHSAHFFLTSKKGDVKKLSFFYIPFAVFVNYLFAIASLAASAMCLAVISYSSSRKGSFPT